MAVSRNLTAQEMWEEINGPGVYNSINTSSNNVTLPQQAYPPTINDKYSSDFQVVALEAAKRGVAEAYDDKVKEARSNRRRALKLGSVSSAYKRHKKKEAKKLIEEAGQEFTVETSKLDARLREYEQRKYLEESERERREYQKQASRRTVGLGGSLYPTGGSGVAISSTNTFQEGDTLTITGGGTGAIISSSVSAFGEVKFDPLMIENLKEQLGLKKKK